MNKLAFLVTVFVPCAVFAEKPPVEDDLRKALVGEWTGVLEYRDYAEPPTSTKRVQLPTWLAITPSGTSLAEHFIYDDGPNKTVDSTQTISFDAAAATYTEREPGKPAVTYAVRGMSELKSGRGELVLTGAGTDDDKPAELRITLAVRRNLITWLDEVRPARSTAAFVFRHRYTFTRARPPAVTTK